MKILVLSLLRLGDILMHQEIIDEIQEKHPASKIDLVINESFESVRPLLSGLNQIHLFPRKEIQNNLVLKDESFFRAYRMLVDWAKKIQVLEYDMVVDLTHNDFSRALVSALKVPEIGKPKRQYINDVFAETNRSSFHYVDALRQSIGLSGDVRALGVQSRDRSYLVLQPLTSDIKKNWPLQNFQKLIQAIHTSEPERVVYIVGAPSERTQLADAFVESDHVKIKICDLIQLKDILQNSEFLISGDTATLHLATLTQTPSLGIFLGSAEPSKTAPRMIGAWLLQSQEACVPCRHSSACSQTEHLCSLSVLSESVFKILNAIWRGNDFEIRKIAWSMPFSVFRTQKNSLGYFDLENLAQPESSILNQLRQQSWFSIYQKRQFSVESIFQAHKGEAWELSLFIEEQLKTIERVREVILDLQDEVRKISRACLRLDTQIEDYLRPLSPLVREFSMLSEDSEWSSCLEINLKNSWDQSSFAVYRKWRTLVDDLSVFYESERSILVSLRTFLREKGVYYVPGPTRAT
jgi:ADP-heptose:LPS heptosyltransferase